MRIGKCRRISTKIRIFDNLEYSSSWNFLSNLKVMRHAAIIGCRSNRSRSKMQLNILSFMAIFNSICGLSLRERTFQSQTIVGNMESIKPFSSSMNIAVNETFPTDPRYFIYKTYQDASCTKVESVKSVVINTCLADKFTSMQTTCGKFPYLCTHSNILLNNI
jgi:hypothetical protein